MSTDVPLTFFTVVSEYDGFTSSPLCWEVDPSRCTLEQAEKERENTPAKYGATWIAVVHVLTHTRRDPDDE